MAGSPPAQATNGSITGRLTTSEGTGAAYHWVQVYTDEGGWVGGTYTDEDGNYSVNGLTGGSYVLAFGADGGAEQYHRQKTSFWEADRVQVTDGQTTRVDEQLLATGTITGRIVDADGNPKPFISVQAADIGSWRFVYGSTDADGTYRLPVLPGRYVVSFQPIDGSYQAQYIPQQLDESSATAFEVTAGAEVVANDTVLSTGSISGRLTTASGEPLAGAWVNLSTSQGNSAGVYQETDGNGEFTVPAVFAGSYKLDFWTADYSRNQYYKGKLSWETADLVTVEADQETRIEDSLLATGSVRVFAVDANTGEAIADFCVDGVCSNGTGSALVTDLPAGEHRLFIYTESDTHMHTTATVQVQPETTIDVTVELRPAARITTTVIDRQTGTPVADVCIVPVKPKDALLPDARPFCSDSTGRVTISRLDAGSYNLFVDATQTSYGMQWVGADGGTGDQREAVTIVAEAGTTVTAPQVKLDPAGTIAGRVVDGANGLPLSEVWISPLNSHPGVGPSLEVRTDTEGRYEFTGLGPYEWPLLFQRHGYAPRWSGGTGNRYQATKIQVTSGETSTHDETLTTGTEVTGSVTDQGGVPADHGFVIARNAVTGDIVGVAWAENGQYDMPVLGKQAVYFTYDLTFGEGFYQGTYPSPKGRSAGDPVHTRVFPVPISGSLTVNIQVDVN
ncbi:MAG TPA: carboxypeptidase regulatory-like domain-containing protein [Micromonosporaceae bacterium]